jgi:hypothetical protein
MAETISIKAFIKANGIRMAYRSTDRNPHMAYDESQSVMNHYRCRLRCGERTMDVYYSMGVAHTRPPKVWDVLDCLASDASGYMHARGFGDWCAEYGYDEDSRKAKRTYDAIGRQADRLMELLGGYDTLVSLLNEVERL